MKKWVLLSILLILIFTTKAQNGNLSLDSTRLDTLQIQKMILEFIRVSFSRANPASISKFCEFPFFNEDWKSKKVYNSSKELETELKNSFQKSNYKHVIYKVDTISVCDTCINSLLKPKSFFCIKLKINVPYNGEGGQNSFMKMTFYVTTELPYHILGIRED